LSATALGRRAELPIGARRRSTERAHRTLTELRRRVAQNGTSVCAWAGDQVVAHRWALWHGGRTPSGHSVFADDAAVGTWPGPPRCRSGRATLHAMAWWRASSAPGRWPLG